MIFPDFPTPFHLVDVIKSFGEPKYVVASALRNPDSNGISYDLRIVYWPQGILLRAGGYGSIQPSLRADMQFDYVLFFEPTDETLKVVLAGSANHPEWLTPWQGIKDFGFYCKDLEDGKVCRGEPW